MKHLRAIDGLRAIAVLAVVAYHAGLPVPAGFVGVDVFFVISGFLITGLLAEEHKDRGRIDFTAFYARRARRILPALLLVILAALSAFWLLPSAREQSHLFQSAVAAVAMLANVHFQSATSGYFDSTSSTMPLLHLWSLAVEEQFYFVWPLLLAVLLRFRRAPLVVAALGLGSLALAQWWLHTTPEAAFYQMPARFWELAAGGWLTLREPRTTTPSWVGHAGLALIGLAIAVPLPIFPGVGAMPAVLGAAMVIQAARSGARLPLLESRPMVFVGLISYALYLWHWPLFAFDRAMHVAPPPLTTSILLIAVAFLLAWATTRFVEAPIRFGLRSAPNRRIVMGGIAACLAVGIATPQQAKEPPPDPFFIAPNLPASIALWGDSHAGAWIPYVRAVGRVEHRGVVDLSVSTCPPTVGYALTINDAKHPLASKSCREWNAAAAKQLASGQFEKVFIAARWLPLFQQMPDGLESPYPTGPASVAKLEAGFIRSLDEIAPHVRQIVIIGPVPQLRGLPETCLRNDAPCQMSRAQFEALAEKPKAFIRTLLARYPNATLLSLDDLMCDSRECPIERDGAILYRDDDHLSEAAVKRMARLQLSEAGERRVVDAGSAVPQRTALR